LRIDYKVILLERFSLTFVSLRWSKSVQRWRHPSGGIGRRLAVSECRSKPHRHLGRCARAAVLRAHGDQQLCNDL